MPAISAVSVWEAHLLMERGAIGAVATPEATVRTWLAAYPIEVVPIDLEVALLSRSLAFTHADPADRFIAATTFKLGRVLATLDENLRALPWLRCLPLE